MGTATILGYSHGPMVEKMEQILSLWVDESNERNISLMQSAICDKAKSLVDGIK
jgi:hypothetical protein